MAQIIRFENSHGEGCYTSGAYFNGEPGLDGHSYHYHDKATNTRHPPPARDEGLEAWMEYGTIPDEYYCGFDSRDKALRWFSSEPGRLSMAERGFVPWAFEVDPKWVISAKAQCVFKRSEAGARVPLDPITLEVRK